LGYIFVAVTIGLSSVT